jgi:hypothetical protein
VQDLKRLPDGSYRFAVISSDDKSYYFKGRLILMDSQDDLKHIKILYEDFKVHHNFDSDFTIFPSFNRKLFPKDTTFEADILMTPTKDGKT